jgi:hypothetical protein
MRDRAVQRAAVAWIGAVLLGGCSMIVDPEPGPEPLACSPGDTNPCRCANAAYGVQFCSATTGSFGSCRDTRGQPCESRDDGAAGRGAADR